MRLWCKPSVIWFRRNCAACELNRDLFARLEKNQQGYRVIRVEASDRRLRLDRFRHAVTAVPQFDVVQRSLGCHSRVYGPDTRVANIANVERVRLANYFPDAGAMLVK